MNRERHPLRSLAFTLVVTALVAGLIVAPGRPAFTDDTELLRQGAAEPFIFLMVDTSASMNLGLGNVWLPGGGDNPSSRIYMALRALREVFEAEENVNLGLGTYNQDKLRVIAKHWIYYADEAMPAAGTWPIQFPMPDADGLTVLVDTLTIDGPDRDLAPDQADGIPDTRFSDVEGDVLTIGTPFPVGTNVPAVRQAGTCNAPLDLDTVVGRRRAQTFAIDPSPSNPSTLWVKKGNKTYRLSVRTDPASQIGNDNFKIQMGLQEVNNSCVDTGAAQSLTRILRLDDHLNDFLMVDGTSSDRMAGLWSYSDILETTDYVTERPHTGFGWEGNYDSNHDGSLNSIASGAENLDRYCTGPGNSGTCVPYKPILQTRLSSLNRVLDEGDMLPLDWTDNHLDEFLDRMSPSSGEYGPAGYFQNDPTNGILLPRDDDDMPLMAVGLSPLNKTINDFRCFYMGSQVPGGKCQETPFFNPGWDKVACQYDRSYGCRRPYLILITDGEDNTGGSAATSEVANMNSKMGIQTWVLNLGDASNCNGGALNSLTQSGKGQCITVADPTNLKVELQNILGQIEQRARTFASAAVPSVQVTVEETVYITNFVPLRNRSFWDGHARAFIKPLVDADGDGKPDIVPCNSSAAGDPPTACHLWDAGLAMLSQAADKTVTATTGSLKLGIGKDQRRVYYSQLPDELNATVDAWPENRRLFDRTSGPPEPVRYDLWRGFNIIPQSIRDDTLLASEETVNETTANGIIARTLAKKEAVADDSSLITYVLGDIFHSNPVIVGGPSNVRYFADDLNAYRDFARKHENRRKMFLFGANDGMLHAIDSGRFWTSRTDPNTGNQLEREFDTGTGRELFAYVPRAIMPRLEQMVTGITHQFTVDGTPVVADVFVDPKVDLNAPDPGDREWRTVAITGLREGGQGYFALDITQPDELDSQNVPVYNGQSDDYVPSCITRPADCADDADTIPFPAALWEFNDSVWDNNGGNGSGKKIYVELDEDDNGRGDLGDTWSTPNIGRIKVCRTAGCTTPVDKYVVVFGGGMDKSSKSTPAAAAEGNWLYMVDIETGEAIYKRPLLGAAPSEPAAVDTNQDGYLDRIYIGTIAGKLYRVDLTADAAGGTYPALENQSVRGRDGQNHTVQRIPATSWIPRVIFDTNYEGSTALTSPSPVRGIYYRPSVLFAAKLGLYALAFGTGDREDLWASYPGVFPRFYVFVDDTDQMALADLPIREGYLQSLDVAVNNTTNSDFLLAPGLSPGRRGWYLRFNEDDRLITDPFSLSGLTIFSTYRPRVAITDGSNGTPVTIVCGAGSSDTNNTCAKRGNSRIFVMNTTNGNSFLVSNGQSIRYKELDLFVTNPFTEQSATQNEGPAEGNLNTLGVDEQMVMESLKSLFPKNCKFGNHRVDIKTVTDEGGVERIAPIPICIIEKNWKEF